MLVHVQVYFYNTILMGDSRLAMEWFISGYGVIYNYSVLGLNYGP